MKLNHICYHVIIACVYFALRDTTNDNAIRDFPVSGMSLLSLKIAFDELTKLQGAYLYCWAHIHFFESDYKARLCCNRNTCCQI